MFLVRKLAHFGVLERMHVILMLHGRIHARDVGYRQLGLGSASLIGQSYMDASGCPYDCDRPRDRGRRRSSSYLQKYYLHLGFCSTELDVTTAGSTASWSDVVTTARFPGQCLTCRCMVALCHQNLVFSH